MHNGNKKWRVTKMTTSNTQIKHKENIKNTILEIANKQ